MGESGLEGIEEWRRGKVDGRDKKGRGVMKSFHSSVHHSCVLLTAREKEVGGILKTVLFVEVSLPLEQALGSGLRCRTRST